MKKMAFLALLAALVSVPAQAFEIQPVAGVNFSNVSVTGVTTGDLVGATYSSKSALTYGVLANFSLVPLLSLQFGALMDTHKFNVTNTIAGEGKFDVTTTMKAWQIPVVVRATVLPGLSLGGGFYYAVATGNVHSETIVTPEGAAALPVVVADETYEKTKNKKSDYGLVASVAYKIPLAPLVSFMIDGRYLLGLNNFNQDTSIGANASSKFRSIELLGGLSIGF